MTEMSTSWAPIVPFARRQNRACAMLLLIYAIIVGLYLCAAADASPSQNDVFRSIHDNVSESDGTAGKVLALMGGGAVLLITRLISVSGSENKPQPRRFEAHPSCCAKCAKRSYCATRR